jgi:pimeloyl-ACP methyl ester carboxylesterase
MYHLVCNPLEPYHRIWYKRHGNPTAPHKLIFTMGLGGTANQWQAQTDYFAQKPDEFQFVVYDNRGMGFSDPVPGRWTTCSMARDALSLLDGLGWTKNVHVIGLSMGGMISQEIVRQGKPGQFISLSLLSTISGGPYSLGLFVLSIPTGLQLAARTFLTPDPKTQLKNGLSLLYPAKFLEAQDSTHPETGAKETNFKAFRRALIKRGIESKKAGMPPQRISSIFKQAFAVFTHNVSEAELNYISDVVLKGNVLVLTGDEDILVHPNNSIRLSHGLKCKIITVPGAGHGANEQVAQFVNEMIEKNIRGLLKGSSGGISSSDGLLLSSSPSVESVKSSSSNNNITTSVHHPRSNPSSNNRKSSSSSSSKNGISTAPVGGNSKL